MPIPKTTRFTAFEFTPEEMYAATRFNQLNLMLIQTLAAEAMDERIDLKIELDKAESIEKANMEFVQREAEIKGKIEAYENLLLLARDTTLPQPEVQS